MQANVLGIVEIQIGNFVDRLLDGGDGWLFMLLLRVTHRFFFQTLSTNPANADAN